MICLAVLGSTFELVGSGQHQLKGIDHPVDVVSIIEARSAGAGAEVPTIGKIDGVALRLAQRFPKVVRTIARLTTN